jgi:hypothetical protein
LKKDASFAVTAGFKASQLLPKRLFAGWLFAENFNQSGKSFDLWRRGQRAAKPRMGTGLVLFRFTQPPQAGISCRSPFLVVCSCHDQIMAKLGNPQGLGRRAAEPVPRVGWR